jgi:SPP1 gp7 family putative phage head morphogenesis protein
MEAADSWEQLSDALLGPFERDIIDGLTGAYRSLEGRIEIAYKRSLQGGSDTPLRQLLVLRQQLEQELQTMRLPADLQQVVNQALLDGQKSADFWALAELNKVKQEARKLTPEQAAQVFADATNDSELLLTPAMVRQNPSAMIAAAQRQNALSNYAAGGRGTQAFAALNRLAEVDLRGRIIGAVEFHLASGDSWRQLRRTLQDSLEVTKSRAQTVARTEMAAAMVEGTKLRYEAEGIQQVQWQAVGSSRTCGYCAPRHGKVYKLGDVVAPAHPNCRCTVTPWDPKWVELGLVDAQAEAKSRADVLADLEAAGKQPISGPTPFEKALGQQRAPEALWSPPRVGQEQPQQPAEPTFAQKLRTKGSAFIRDNAPGLQGALGNLQKLDGALQQARARATALASAVDIDQQAYKEATTRYARLVDRKSRGTAVVIEAMQKLRGAMLKTPLNKNEITRLVQGVDWSGWGTKSRLAKPDAAEFIAMFNGQGFTATTTGSWIKRIEPDYSGRGYNTGTGVVAVRVSSKGNMFHELTHTIEMQRPEMGEIAQEWASRRAFLPADKRIPETAQGRELRVERGKPIYRLNQLLPQSGYKDNEITWADDYLDPYMGKLYDYKHDGATTSEVWTMAVEHFANETDMAKLAKKHPDLFQMVVGLSQQI